MVHINVAKTKLRIDTTAPQSHVREQIFTFILCGIIPVPLLKQLAALRQTQPEYCPWLSVLLTESSTARQEELHIGKP